MEQADLEELGAATVHEKQKQVDWEGQRGSEWGWGEEESELKEEEEDEEDVAPLRWVRSAVIDDKVGYGWEAGSEKRKAHICCFASLA